MTTIIIGLFIIIGIVNITTNTIIKTSNRRTKKSLKNSIDKANEAIRNYELRKNN
jgi:hypothetical protein